MKFVTHEEARTLASRQLGANGLPTVATGREIRRESFEAAPGYTYFARAREIVDALGYFDWCLLWVALTEVWPSNENLHLYYRFRESYGDRSHIDERPAVVALRHETVDLVSFVHLGMMFGWEMYLVTSHDYGRAFISHDGFFELAGSEATAQPQEPEDHAKRAAT